MTTVTATAADRTQRLLEMTGRLADDFATRADEHDRDNSFPFENFAKLKGANYIALPIAEELGGLGGTLLDFALCQERLAQGCASTALAINMHLFALGSMMEGMQQAGIGEMQGKLMASMLVQGKLIIGGGFTEAEIGGNWGFPTTKAVRESRDGMDGFVLNGRKTFTSLSPIIDLFSVNTSTTDADGTPVIGMFVVPRGTPGIEIIETWDTMSMRATASHDMVLQDCWVPTQACVGLRAPGDMDVGANVLLAWFCCSVASVYLGVAVAARNFAIEWAKTRKPVLFERPIGHFPGVQFRVADMEVELAAARALVRQTAEEWMGGGLRAREDLARIVLTKYQATNAAVRVVDQAMTIVGAAGIFRRHPMQRYYRDVRPGPFHPMTNDVALELIGKTALGIPMEFTPRWA
ncbi:MAG TPA: acyl-CoA dehydrogenase family protein [Dehalococcoidia bacterium]|nr:acyl-CoA dehydrogenase family protein [Dehalococcoidia bacterium]